MTTKSRLALLSTLAATPAFAAPFLAIGDNAELFLTARTEARYEDNVTFASDDELSDEIFEFVPGVELTFGKNSLTSGSFSFREQFIAYSDNTVFNEELATIAFNSDYSGAKLKLSTQASFSEKNQNSRDAQLDNKLIRRDVTAVGVKGEYAATEKSKVGAGLRFDRTDYLVAGFTDRDVYSAPVNYYFAITPKVDLSAGIEYRKTDVDANNADSDQMFYNVGARGEFTPKLSGTFRVGYSVREDDNDNDSELVGVDAGLLYAYSLKTQFTLDLRNDFDSSSTGSGQEVSSVTVGVRSALTTVLSASASVGFQQIDYINSAIDRKDDYLTANLGVTYTLNQYVTFDAYYNYFDNSSKDNGTIASTADFKANIFAVAANFRY